MCSIMGFPAKTPTEKARVCFDRSVHRGLDMSRVANTGCDVNDLSARVLSTRGHSGQSTFSMIFPVPPRSGGILYT